MSILACVTVVFTGVVLWRLRRQPVLKAPARDVLLLRPVDAASEAEKRALSTPIHYDGHVEHIVIGETDPGVHTFIATQGDGRNRKLQHLRHALRTLDVRGRAVIIADADVYVDAELITALTEIDADIVVAPPVPESGLTRPLLAHTLHNFRALLTISNSICGKAIALSPRAQRALLEIDDCVAEDLQLAERVDTIAVARRDARTLPSPGLARFTRWMQVLRAHKPLAFVSVPVFIAPLPLLVFADWRAFLAAFVARALLAVRLNRQGWYLFWLGEPLLLAAFVAALFKRQILWRDHILTVGKHGRILAAVHR